MKSKIKGELLEQLAGSGRNSHQGAVLLVGLALLPRSAACHCERRRVAKLAVAEGGDLEMRRTRH